MTKFQLSRRSAKLHKPLKHRRVIPAKDRVTAVVRPGWTHKNGRLWLSLPKVSRWGSAPLHWRKHPVLYGRAGQQVWLQVDANGLMLAAKPTGPRPSTGRTTLRWKLGRAAWRCRQPKTYSPMELNQWTPRMAKPTRASESISTIDPATDTHEGKSHD